jgi:hypothetical protein
VFIASLAKPGGNLTGMLHVEAGIVGKWLAMLREMAPGLSHAALVANPRTTPFDYFLRAAQHAAPSFGIELVPRPVATAGDIERAIEALARVPDSGMLLPPDSTTVDHRTMVIDLAARHRVPAVYAFSVLSPLAVSCLMGLTRLISSGMRQITSTASCAVINRPTFQCRNRPDLKPPSTSKLRKRLASQCPTDYFLQLMSWSNEFVRCCCNA